MTFFEPGIKRAALLMLMFYAVMIMWLSLTPGSDAEPYFPHDDKLMHFIAYLLFALLCIPFIQVTRTTMLCATGIFLFGALMEFGQMFVPMRQTSFLDLLANTLGMMAGMVWARKLRLLPLFQKLL